jgi:hypothetical protein
VESVSHCAITKCFSGILCEKRERERVRREKKLNSIELSPIHLNNSLNLRFRGKIAAALSPLSCKLAHASAVASGQ